MFISKHIQSLVSFHSVFFVIFPSLAFSNILYILLCLLHLLSFSVEPLFKIIIIYHSSKIVAAVVVLFIFVFNHESRYVW